MKQKKTNRVALLLRWAGEQKVWLFLAVLLAMAGGLCIVVPYIEIYRLMDAAFGGGAPLCAVRGVWSGIPQGSLRRAVQGALYGSGTHG